MKGEIMLNYDPTLAKIMRNEKTFTEKYGIEIQLKSIPDEAKPGVFDPREFELVKAQANAFTKMAFDQAANPQASLEENVQMMRDMMGFPNLNMNTVEICMKYITVQANGNDVGVWVYYPRRPERKTGHPGFIYIHGGWVGGTPFTLENPCCLLAERADCVVFNIDYAFAPEKPYLNGFNDCFSVLEHVYNNAETYGVDREKLGMGGDSAGGNLAAACAVRDRDEGKNMLKYQALLYPIVTLVYEGIEDFDWNIEDYEISDAQRMYIEPCLVLGRPRDGDERDDDERDGDERDGDEQDGDDGAIGGMTGLYLHNGEDPRDTYISPIFADKKGLCKTLIAGAEFDGLRISGEVYGKMLLDAGVDVRVLRYKGVGHGFLNKLGVLPQAEDLVQEMADDIKGMYTREL